MLVDARDQLSTFALGVILLSLVLFVAAPTPATGASFSPPAARALPGLRVVETKADPRIAAPMALEKTITESQIEGGVLRYEVTISNQSPADPVTIRHLDVGEVGDAAGLGNCQMPQVIGPGEAYRCSFDG